MDYLFAWQNVVFYIPLTSGIILVLGSAFGGHQSGKDAEHDLDHDAGAGGDHDVGTHDAGAHDGHHGGEAKGDVHIEGSPHDGAGAGGLMTKAFSLLGVGRVPLTILLMMASFLFGGIGVIMNTLLSPLIHAPSLYGPISISVAFLGMVTLTGRVARLISRIMPSTETYRVSSHDLVGRTGVLLVSTDPSSGAAQVKDHEGNVHNVRCRTPHGSLPKGTEILVLEYRPDTATYLVETSPVSPTSITRT